ncbi:MAG: hypothetical protein JW910_09240, partial [Anaerolineae bacterium]|nr:hypothetical protein [Anaerolineae bacterium]
MERLPNLAQLSGSIAQYLDRLVEPVPTVIDYETRLNSRLLMALFIVTLPLGLITAALPALTGIETTVADNWDLLAMIGGVIFWVLAYGLARYGRYRLAAYLTIITACLAIFVMVLVSYQVDPDPLYPDPFVKDFDFLIVPLLLASLLLSFRSAFWLLVCTVIAITITIPVFMAPVPIDDFLRPLLFISIGGALVLIATRHRERLESHRAQFIELANEAVRDSESRYRTLVQHAKAGIFEFDLIDLHITDTNEQFCAWTG